MKRHLPNIILLLVAVLAYGLFLPQLGFYWDDLPISWIRYQLGPEALTRYFSTNRPIWGMLYQLTTSFIPHEPIYWQAFALFWRWLGAVVVFSIVEKLWKDKPRFALGVALLFLVYPGFNQQWSAFLYSHFFIVLFFFLYSNLLMLRAIEEPKRAFRHTFPGMIFSALNLWMMEYFYILELMRIGVIFTAMRGEILTLRERAVRAFKLWLPYLLVFIAAVLSRLFIFNNQIYGFGLGDQLQSAPFETVIELARTIRFTLVLVLHDAWVGAVLIPEVASFEADAYLFYAVSLGGLLLAFLGMVLLPKDRQFMEVSRLEDVLSSVRKDESPEQSGITPVWKRSIQNLAARTSDAFWAIGLGLFAVLLSGWPFWLIGFVPSLAWPASRFTLPFMFGAGLIVAGIGLLIPWQALRYLLLAAIIGFAAGRQHQWADEYRQDWQTQKELIWQLAWRAPGIAPDTAIIMNEGGLKFFADNSLSPVVNWVYAPDERDDHIEYVLLYPTTRLRSDALPSLEPDQPIFTDYLTGTFNGSTSQALAIYFAPPRCMRILDPDIDRVNRTIPEGTLMRFAARLSNHELILPEGPSRMPRPYLPEPEHGWCHHFQRAELARQIGDWEQVRSLADAAFQFERPSEDPAELFVFIEGYAHAREWDRAIELSKEAHQASPEIVGEMLCRLWERVRAEAAPGVGRNVALAEIRRLFTCNP
jgi:hypothetical protein